VRGQLLCGHGVERWENGEVEEATAGGEFTGRCGVERAEATEGDAERIGCQTVGLVNGDGLLSMVSRAAAKAVGNLVEAGGGPGPSDARVAVGKQAGVRAAVGGERREERAIGMPAARDRGSRPGVIGRNLWRRMGLGPFRKREGGTLIRFRKRTAARDSGSVCPEERQRSRTPAFTNPRLPAKASEHRLRPRPEPVRSGLGGATGCDSSGSSCTGR
jgi:hypothetical protein